MKAWQIFEIECAEHLKKEFGDYAEFIYEGGSDSTVPDIKVITKCGDEFYIEVKHTPAQCGQFVLRANIDKKRFEYSPLNATPFNESAKVIMDHMDKDFEYYKEAGTAGKDIDLGDNGAIFLNWIMSYYKHKGVRFFITNEFTLFPIEDFQKHFLVSAKYRTKRSGSNSVGKSNCLNVYNYILRLGYDISDYNIIGSKLFIESPIFLHNERFVFRNYEYMFSKREDKYEIRKLTNTFNANVIFSIEKKPAIGLSNSEFINYL